MTTNLGTNQDFPLRGAMGINKADIKSGFLKPSYPLLAHPETLAVPLTDANIITTTFDLIKGYYYESQPLTAGRTLTLPSATDMTNFLIYTLKLGATTIPGTNFQFVVDNTQAGAFTRTLLAGAGVTLQGSGFDVSMGEIATFSLNVNSTAAVSISRSNFGPSSTSTLAEVLVAGNATGGSDIDVTGGDSITSTGQLPLLSSQAAVDAVRVNASNAAGGIDVDAGTGGVTIDTTGGLSLDAAAASNFSTTVGTLTLASNEAAAGGVVNITSLGTGVSAIDINSSGGVSVDYAAGSNATVTSGGTVISTFGTAAAPNLTVNNGNLSFATVTRGIESGPTNGTVAANAVTTSGTAGIITDSGVIAIGNRASITVTNSAVVADSQIFIQVSGGATAALSAALTVDVNTVGVGSYVLDVTNNDGANPTTGTPTYHYLIVNPA